MPQTLEQRRTYRQKNRIKLREYARLRRIKYPEYFKGYYQNRKEKLKAYRLVYNEKNKELLKQKAIQVRADRKLMVMRHYSKSKVPFCKNCGEKNISVLTIDHINNDGIKERKMARGSGGWRFYRLLVKENFPDRGYQVLCFNCNCGKAVLGKLPKLTNSLYV